MSYYNDVYLKRLNRYGKDYQSRIQGQRERVFEDLLTKSIYRVDFNYNSSIIPGILEKYRQDDSETLAYLLLRINTDIPAGTILTIPNKNFHYGEELNRRNSFKWMILFLENMRASGYNRYTVIKLSHYIEWHDENKEKHGSWAYLFGQEDNVIRDIVLGGRKGTLYREPEITSTMILPTTKYIKRDVYFEVRDEIHDITEAYRVTGYDIQSNFGVEYVTLDPVYERDKSPIPIPTEDDNENEYYWLNGGEVSE